MPPAKKTAPKKPSRLSTAPPSTIRRERRTAKLDLVQPNDWNFNVLSEHKYESLLHDMRTEGWVASQPLCIWATDEKGRVQNKIINGEHRWKAAIEVGFREGPMVFIHGITRAQAIELTFRLDHPRGTFNADRLRVALNEIHPKMNPATAGLTLGFTHVELNKAFALPPIRLDDGREGKGGPAVGGADGTSRNNASKQIPLYLDATQQVDVPARLKELMKQWKLPNVTAVVMRCVSEVAKEKPRASAG